MLKAIEIEKLHQKKQEESAQDVMVEVPQPAFNIPSQGSIGKNDKDIVEMELIMPKKSEPEPETIGSKETTAKFTIQDDDEEISFEKLQRYMMDQHPTHTVTDQNGENPHEQYYPVCAPLGSIPLSCCKIADTEKLAKSLGIGPTLFLMTTKAFGWFFLFITILNIPVFGLYYNGNPNQIEGASVFERLTLGNIG